MKSSVYFYNIVLNQILITLFISCIIDLLQVITINKLLLYLVII